MPPKDRKHPAFFRELSKHGNAAVAADVAGLDLAEVKKLRQTNEDFASAWSDAVELAEGRLEVAAYNAALQGFSKPLHGAGKLTVDKDGNPVTVSEYDTRLITYMIDRQKEPPSQKSKEVPTLPPVRIIIAGTDEPADPEH